MEKKIKNLKFLNNVFNIHSDEWKIIIKPWLVRFLYKFGFVIAWTVLVVLFVTNYGIKSLPILFALNALFAILGTFLYSFFVDKYSNIKLMYASLIVSILLLSITVAIYNSSPILFFSFLIINIAIFLNQFKIGLNSYTEELFNALQSERTFPFLEAAETIGGIFAGLFVMSFSSNIDAYHFIYPLISSLLLIIPIILFSDPHHSKLPKLKSSKKRKDAIKFSTLLSDNFSVKEFQFVKGLTIIIALQWLIFNLLEFQYTSAVYNNISNVIIDAGGGFEHAFIHDLGTLFLIFSCSALIIQLVIGSRIITSLGIVGTFLLHCIVSLFGFITFIFSFNFITAVFVKNNFTMTNILQTNAYHSTYYVVKEKNRQYVREFLEGIVRPLGALIGTLLILAVQYIFNDSVVTINVNFLLLFFIIIALIVSYRQQKLYTSTASFDLFFSDNKKDKYNAIDVLAQKGHKHTLRYYKKVLNNPKESISVQVRTIKSILELNNKQKINSVDILLTCLESNKKAIRLNALLVLSRFLFLRNLDNQSVHIKYKLIRSLKKLYKQEKNEDVILMIIQVMSNISGVSTIEFLLKVLTTSTLNGKVQAIIAIGAYDNTMILDKIKPFLKSKNLKLKSASIVSLYKYDQYRNAVLSYFKELLENQNSKNLPHILFIIGELNLIRYKQIPLRHIDSKNKIIKLSSALALVKMDYEFSFDILSDLLFDDDIDYCKTVYNEVSKLDVRIYKKIASIVKYNVDHNIDEILNKEDVHYLKDFNLNNLLKLKWFYRLTEQYEEVEIINTIITNNK